jgi:hypothetical protein
MGRLDSTSTPRAKTSTSSATYRTPLMTPPPTPQKPKPKSERKDQALLKQPFKANKLKEILEGTKSKKQVKREHVRQAARAAEPANNGPSKPVKHKSVTFDAVVAHMDAIVKRSASKPTATLAPVPTHSLPPPKPLYHSAHPRSDTYATIQTETPNCHSAADFCLTTPFDSATFTHPDPILSSVHEFLLGMRAEQSALCQQTDTLELRLRGTLSTAERRRVEKMLELTVALGCELVIEEGGFGEVCERRMGDEGWDLEGEFKGLSARVGRAVEVYDAMVGGLRGN